MIRRVFLLGLFVLGCETSPATPGDGGMATPDASARADVGCVDEESVRTQVFAPTCTSSACHDDSRPKAGLDLESPGLRARLAEMSSVHEACADRRLLVPGSPAESFLMSKVLGTHGECGDPMPGARRSMSPAQRQCIAEWIAAME